jgi:hypothetical protein
MSARVFNKRGTAMSGELELTENDEERIADTLVGRRIVRAETGQFDYGARWTKASGRLELDNGTRVYVVPNEGGCSCGAGDYELTHLASVDNIITSARCTETTTGYGDYGDGPTRYQVFVVADATEINLLTIDGDDGNGYYGTGYRLIVVPSVGGPNV